MPRRGFGIIAGLLLLLTPAVTSGQTSTMTIEVPDPRDADPAETNTNLDFFGSYWAVFVDGFLCSEGEVPSDGGAFTIEIGGEDQPSACRGEGGTVELAGSSAGPLWETFEFAAGTTAVVENRVPHPADSSLPEHICTWLEADGTRFANCEPLAQAPAPAEAGTGGLSGDGKSSATQAILFALALTLLVGSRIANTREEAR